jgi:hypothetical protein
MGFALVEVDARALKGFAEVTRVFELAGGNEPTQA